VAIGTLYGDIEFILFPLPIGIKARYIAVIYALVSLAMMFGAMRMYALRNWVGRWPGCSSSACRRAGILLRLQRDVVRAAQPLLPVERRKAARKFEVYMRSQGRTVRFDGNGRQIDDDHDDKKRWN